jgi:hypothetical protein
VAFGVAVPVLLLVLAQAILPTLAARVIRDRVKPYGDLESVHVSAWPAVELLWGKADSVSARSPSLRLTLAQLTKLELEMRGIHDLDLTAKRFELKVPTLPNGIALLEATIRKRGMFVDMQATLTQADLQAALPSGFTAQPVASGEGQVEVRASGSLFGVQMSMGALVKPLEGRLVVEPRGFPLAGIATVTLFSDPHLEVESVGVRVDSRQPPTYRLSIAARLR